jgi:hypothetical protein
VDWTYRGSHPERIRRSELACYTQSPLKSPPPGGFLLFSTFEDSMERAGRLLKDQKINRALVTAEDIAKAAWPSAVGKAIASHTSRLRLVRDKLVVEVEDAVWQSQLHTLSWQILERLRKLTGSAEVQSLEFRIGVPRREPQRASTRESGLLFASAEGSRDEADSIADPVLKKVYRLSRKKATA